MSPEEAFLKQISNVVKLPPFEAQDKLSEILKIDPSQNKYIVDLQERLQNVDDSDIASLITRQNFFDGDWPGFEELIASFFKYCRDINPWSSLESFDLIAQFYSDLGVSFANNRGVVLISTIFQTTTFIIPLATDLDSKLDPHRKPRLSFISTILLKLFNNSRSDAKKSIMLFIGISLCKVYFKIDSPLLCQNVYSIMNGTGLNFRKYPKSQQVEYRFILGKFYLIKNQLVNAFHHLQWSYQNCIITSNRNIELILNYLIPVGMLIGKLPNYNLLGNFRALAIYKPLVYYMKKGDIQNFMKYLYDNQLFFKQKKLYILLIQRSRILIIRNLFRKIYIQMNFPTKVRYDYFLAGLRYSTNVTQYVKFFQNESVFKFFLSESSINDEFIENLFISLIDQNLVRGKIFPRLRTISLAKQDAFPNIYNVYTQKFLINRSDNWLDDVML